ncbi:MAG TPA: SH3 domain-containing protein [Thermoanaerobaculia bacterium]|nr:SH3 domain-containing protein [Thermoanaerobaculia bacterium]
MTHRAALVLAFALLACKEEPVVTETVDNRSPIRVAYVGAPELPVRAAANDTAEVIATYSNGEAVSVLAEKGDWVEVRSGAASGWAKAADLTDAAGKTAAEENPEPKFKVIPMPVSAPSAHGAIYIRAKVNTEGEITSTEILENTTGNTALAEQNANSLKSAKFFPMVVKGERKQFEYFHRVSY